MSSSLFDPLCNRSTFSNQVGRVFSSHMDLHFHRRHIILLLEVLFPVHIRTAVPSGVPRCSGSIQLASSSGSMRNNGIQARNIEL